MRVRQLERVAALLVVLMGAGCGPALEIIDQGILKPTGTLPFAATDLPVVAQQTLEVTASVDGLIATTALQLDREAGTFEGELPFAIDDDRTVDVRLEIRAAYDPVQPPVLLGWVVMQDVTLRSRDEVPLEVTGFVTAPIEDTEDEAVALDNRRLDLNRNATSNLDDLLRGCDPDVPPLAVRLSATDLQFPSGTAPGEFARQVLVLDSRRETDVQWWAQVVGAPGAGIGPLEVDAAVQPTPQASLGTEAEPNTLAADDEALIAVTYAPTDTRISTGLVIVETLDSCDVRQAGAVRLIGNPDGQLPSPLPADAYPPIAASLQPLAAGLDLGEVPVNVDATFNLLNGQQLPLTAVAPGGAPVELADLPLRAAALVRVPAGTDVGLALVDLDADADLAIAELDDTGALGELTVISHPGTDAEATAFDRTDADRDLFVGVLDASVEGDRSESYALFFRAFTVAAFDPEPIAPKVGPVAGGTQVTITGRGFAPGATVAFAEREATDVVVDPTGTSLTATTPLGTLVAGLNPATLTVTNPAIGQAEPQVATAPAAFTYAPNAPTVERVQPPSVGIDQDVEATVSVFGSGFTTFFGAVEVAFGELGDPDDPEPPDNAIDVTSVSVISERELQVTFTRPSAVTVPVRVRIQGPEGPLVATLDDGFSVVSLLPDPPSLSGISPASGPSAASVPVTVTGADFVQGAQVLFGEEAAATTFVDASTLTAITPALEPGEVEVGVRNPDGKTSATTLTYVVFEAETDAPVLTAVSPTTVHAAVPGDVMTLFGQALNAQAITSAVVDDGAGGESDLTVLSVVGAFVSVRVDEALPSGTGLVARLTFEDGTEVTSPSFSAAPPAAYAAQVSTGVAAEGEDFSLVVAGDQLFPSQLTDVILTGPSTLTPTVTSASEATVRLAVTGAVQGTYDLELAYTGGYTVTLTAAVAVAGDCGDGVKTPDEACDGSDFGADSCLARGYLGGQLSCTAECTVELGLCTSCGDGVRDGPLGEACDSADLGSETCASLGYTEGTLACTDLCTYDATGCSFCGDGIASGNETCDGVDVRGATCAGLGYDSGGPILCRDDCSALDVLACETCGDGVCTGTEDNTSCPADCVGTCNDGNNTCDMGEDCSTCPTDCDLCAPYSAAVTGGDQTTTIGLAMGLPVVVTVTDEQGDPVPGAVITFGHLPGGHTDGDTDNVSVTDAAGVATAVVHAGFRVGAQTLDVTGVGPAGVAIEGLPITLTFTAEDVPVGTVFTIANAPQAIGWDPHPSGSALLSPLWLPNGIDAHPEGGAVIALQANHRVVRVTGDGELVLIGGNGTENTFSGEGGPAVDAVFDEPRGVAVADDGTVFVAIRGTGQSLAHIGRIDPDTGIYTVFAGNSPTSYPEDGNGRVGSEARVSLASDLSIDPSTGDLLLFPGAGNQRVRRIDLSTSVITGVIGSSAACDITGATGAIGVGQSMGVGPDGTVYVADDLRLNGCSAGDERILARLPDERVVSTSATGASTVPPLAIAVDPAGDLYAWTDGNVYGLEKVDRLGRVTTLLGDNGSSANVGEYVPAADASAGGVADFALMPNGDLWFTSSGSHNVRVIRGIAATGAEPLPTVTLTVNNVGAITTTPLQPIADPIDVTVEVSDGAPAEGMLVTAVPVEGHRLEQVTERVTSLQNISFFTYGALVPGVYAHEVRPRTREREVIAADVITVDIETLPAATGLIYPAFNGTGVAAPGPFEESATLQRIEGPRGIATGPDGSLYVSDFDNSRVFRVTPDGRSTHFAGNGVGGGVATELGVPTEEPMPNIYAVAAADDGDVFVSTVEGSNVWRIYKIEADDGLVRLFAGGGASGADGITAISASLTNVQDLTWDPVTQRLYITAGTRIRYVEGNLISSLSPDLANCSINFVNGVEAMPGGHLAAALSLSCAGTNPFSQGRGVFDIDVLGGGPAVELTDTLTLAGGNSAADALGADPNGDGTLFVDTRDGIARIDPDGTTTILTGPGTGLGTQGSALGPVLASPTTYVDDPISMAVGIDGTLYFAEEDVGRVRAFADPAGFTP
jgi:hypothetical protein